MRANGDILYDVKYVLKNLSQAIETAELLIYASDKAGLPYQITDSVEGIKSKLQRARLVTTCLCDDFGNSSEITQAELVDASRKGQVMKKPKQPATTKQNSNQPVTYREPLCDKHWPYLIIFEDEEFDK